MKTWKEFLTEQDDIAPPMPGQRQQPGANPAEQQARSRLKVMLSRAIDDVKELRHLPEIIGQMVDDALQSIGV